MQKLITNAVNEEAAKPASGSEITVAWLLSEIDNAEKREKHYRKDVGDVVRLYEGVKKRVAQYNILYSNTDTLQPALYNSTPRPVVQRRFKSDNDMGGKAATMLTQRLLTFLLQDETPDYATFDDLIKDATLSALLTSRGLTRFKYDAEIEEPGESPQDAKADSEGRTNEEPGPQETNGLQPEARVLYDCVYGEQVPWNNFLHGYAKRWTDVPWVDFIHLMTEDEFRENFPDAKLDMSKLLKDCESEASGNAGQMSAEGSGAVTQDEVKNVTLIPVHELWLKKSRKVYFLSAYCDDWLKKAVDDPLELRGFFPMPQPLNFMQRLSGLVPLPLYEMYREQAEELNRITLRITKIVEALKVRGAYDSNVEALEKILEADDNTMVPISNVEVLYAQNSNLDRALWFAPIEKLVPVLQQLYTQRQQIKSIIFEITGIADIMRGSTQASETLGAQEIKNQWGTLRLKRMQKAVMRYVRDCMRILAELALTKLQPERIRAMTGSELPSAKDKAMAQMATQQAQAQQQQPDPKQLAVASMPSFEEILELLKSDLNRAYKIDIETNSTIDAEATEDKQDIIEVLTAIGQYLTSVGPLIQQKVLPFDAAKTMLLMIVRKFKFGLDIEDQIAQMKEPEPPPEEGKSAAPQEDPAVAKMQAESAMMLEQQKQATLKMQGEQEAAKHQATMQELQYKAELAAAKFKMEMTKLAMTPAPAPAASGGGKPPANKPR